MIEPQQPTTSTMAMSSPRAPDPLVRGLPMPALSPAKHRRVGWRWQTFFVWFAFVATIATGRAIFGPAASIVALVAVVAAIVVVFRGVRGFVAGHNAVLGRMLTGDFDGAVEGFDGLARRLLLSGHRALTLYNLGIAELRRGQLEEALSLFSAVHQSKHFRAQPLIGPMIPLFMAEAYARLGDVVAARTWLESQKPEKTGLVVAQRTATELLVLTREGRPEDAEALAVGAWPMFEHALQGAQLQQARIVRALAASMRGQPTTTLLAPLRPATPGRLAPLGTSWPEMQAFLVAEELL